jgi:hypothetical protein
VSATLFLQMFKYVLTGELVTRGLYYKILQIRNVQQIDRLTSKLVSFILMVTSTLSLTNTLANYKICTLRSCNVFIVQAPGEPK